MKKKKKIVFIPGGPGLGAGSFKKLFLYLEGDFEPHLYYPMGTGGRELETKEPFYSLLLEDLDQYVRQIGSEVILCGHSFGGLLASDLIYSKGYKSIVGLIVIGAPLSERAFKSMGESYELRKGAELKEAEEAFLKEPNNETLKKYLLEYKEFFFASQNVKAGQRMLLEDTHCAELCIHGREKLDKIGNLLQEIAKVPLKKIFIAGEEEWMLTLDVAKKEAQEGNFEFEPVKGAGHFVHFEDPSATAALLKKHFINLKEVKTL